MKIKLLALLVTALVSLCVPAAAAFRRGDVNDDSRQDLSDAVVVLGHLFLGSGPLVCDDAADVNDDGKIDISDPVRLLNHLFSGAEVPPPPYLQPGEDPTADGLDCGKATGCGARPARPASLACDSGQPCSVLEDVLIQAEPHARNDAPAVAVAPDGTAHVLYSVAEGGYFGFHASRQPGGEWITVPMTNAADDSPVALATADLVVDEENGPRAVINSGDLHTRLWQLAAAGGGAWREVDELTGLDGGRNHTLAATTSGCLVQAATTDTGGQLHAGVARRQDTWSFTPVPVAADGLGAVIALASDGEGHVAYWTTGAGGWQLRVGDAAGSEPVTDLGSNALERSSIAFELDQGSRPHVLLSRPLADQPGAFAVEHWTRDENGAWLSTELAREETRPDCPQPEFEGQMCELEYTTHTPLRVLAEAGGRTLFLWAEVRVHLRLVATCGGFGPEDPRAPAALPPPPPVCQWSGSEERSGKLLAGWIEDGSVRSTVMVPDMAPFSLDAAVDASGQIHLAAYEQQGDQGFRVRYLRVGTR